MNIPGKLLGILVSISSIIWLQGCTKDAQDPPQVTQKPPALLQEPTPEQAGQKVFARCRACHTINQGGKHRVGPNLWKIFGRKAGTVDGYAFSKAMIASDVIWSKESLDAYIANPKAFMPGNKMAFIGLQKEQDRKNLIAYLEAKTSAQ